MKNSIQSTMLATLLMLALGTAASAVPLAACFFPILRTAMVPIFRKTN